MEVLSRSLPPPPLQFWATMQFLTEKKVHLRNRQEVLLLNPTDAEEADERQMPPPQQQSDQGIGAQVGDVSGMYTSARRRIKQGDM